MTIKERIKEQLEKDGAVENFWCIDNRITTRLGAFIFKLKAEGWVFDEEQSGFIGDSKNYRYVVKEKPALKLFN